MREEEILSVARFKLGDTARRLAVLAESATDVGVRATLFELAEMLRAEQRAIEHRPGGAKTIGREVRPLRSERNLPGSRAQAGRI
jgi:hypothetical protein